jgi:hypothetical protein
MKPDGSGFNEGSATWTGYWILGGWAIQDDWERALPGGWDYVDRNVFHEIRSDSWKWRKDRSFDGGKTWVEGVSFIEARRSGSDAAVDAATRTSPYLLTNARATPTTK